MGVSQIFEISFSQLFNRRLSEVRERRENSGQPSTNTPSLAAMAPKTTEGDKAAAFDPPWGRAQPSPIAYSLRGCTGGLAGHYKKLSAPFLPPLPPSETREHDSNDIQLSVVTWVRTST